jgi:phage repressor protein C with HTH and peptisase S24 domain
MNASLKICSAENIALRDNCQRISRYSTYRDLCWNKLMKIGQKIRQARKALKLSQEDLAERCGFEHQSRISGYETGKREPGLEELAAIAKGLNTTVSELVSDTDMISEPPSNYPVTHTESVVAVTHRAMPLSATFHGKYIHEGEDEHKEPMYYQAAWINKMGLRPEALVVRQVKGSSMEPALNDGDSVLINCASREPIHGRCFWVMVENEACVKRIIKLHGSWWIASDNPAHKVRDIQLEDPGQIMGEVVIKSSSHI